MASQTRRDTKALFADDEPALGSHDDESSAQETYSSFRIILIGGGAVALVLLAVLWMRLGDEQAEVPETIRVELVGPPVGRLQPGCPVVLGGLQVGEVVLVQLAADTAVAELSIAGDVGQRLREGTRLFVRPGLVVGRAEMGVLIEPDSHATEPMPRRVVASLDATHWATSASQFVSNAGPVGDLIADPTTAPTLLALIATICGCFVAAAGAVYFLRKLWVLAMVSVVLLIAWCFSPIKHPSILFQDWLAPQDAFVTQQWEM